MSIRTKWIMNQVAPTIQELGDGDGCHIDEAISLINYLDQNLDLETAAGEITAAVLQEDAPREEIYRLWALLAEALVHLEDDRGRLLALLAEIQNLPPSDALRWYQLPGFGNMWSDLYTRVPSSTAWGPITLLRQRRKAIATAEAEMYVQDVGGISELWGYETLNLVCSAGHDLEYRIFEMYRWLEIAGSKLARNLQPGQVKSFTRTVKGRPDKGYCIEATLAEHWEHWKKNFLQLSQDEQSLSVEAKELARQCYGMMKGLAVTMPWSR
ncbi:hypothetical protein F66182_8177 [Fusarium sp. NRRL 66182]|nr:hypothetical protein F66182_8177 [Fusarium sp. NRRL 66182]